MNRPTRLLTVDPAFPDPSALDEAAALLLAGELVVFPTETVYGLGADAAQSRRAAAGIYEQPRGGLATKTH